MRRHTHRAASRVRKKWHGLGTQVASRGRSTKKSRGRKTPPEPSPRTGQIREHRRNRFQIRVRSCRCGTVPAAKPGETNQSPSAPRTLIKREQPRGARSRPRPFPFFKGPGARSCGCSRSHRANPRAQRLRQSAFPRLVGAKNSAPRADTNRGRHPKDTGLVRSRIPVGSYSDATLSFALPGFFTYRSSHAVHRAHWSRIVSFVAGPWSSYGYM